MTKLATLQDTFPGSALDGGLWVVDSGTPFVAASAVAFAYDTGAGTVIHSAATYDMVGSRVAVRVTPPTLDDTLSTFFKAMTSTVGGLQIVLIGTNPGALKMRMIDSAGATTDVALSYDPVDHAWWRLAESGGVAYWDTSANGSGWVNRRTAVHGLNLPAVTVTLATVLATVGATGYGSGGYGSGPYGG